MGVACRINEKRTGVSQRTGLLFSVRGESAPGLLNTLLAQASAGSRALTSLELGVALADDVERPLALHNLAISVAALHRGEGGKNFHDSWLVVWLIRF